MAEGSNDSPSRQRLVSALKLARRLLPGDASYGDRLSATGSEPRHVLARRLAEVADRKPSLLSEAGLGVLQVWEAVTEGAGRDPGETRLAVAFTDLVGFSSWALEAGDDASLELLRDVARAIEPPVLGHGGEVVKRLGDGMMATFEEPSLGAAAIFEARDRLAAVEAPGYRPRIRAGLHVGTPKRIGGDYIGVDVNIAARVADEASADELLVSDQALAALDRDALRVKKKLLFRAKGVPGDVTVYSVRPRS